MAMWLQDKDKENAKSLKQIQAFILEIEPLVDDLAYSKIGERVKSFLKI